MGKYSITIDMSICKAADGCPLMCLHACPTKVIAHRPLDPADPSAGVHIQATHPLLCNGCMDCVNACEAEAISISASS